MSEKKYVVWRRNSNESHLDDYVGLTVHAPVDDNLCWYTVLHEGSDFDEAKHITLNARDIEDITEHKRQNCAICWTADPSLI